MENTNLIASRENERIIIRYYKVLLLQFVEMHRMIKSTCFSHKNIHKETWKMPGSKVVNQIDYIIISSRYASAIIDVRTMKGLTVIQIII